MSGIRFEAGKLNGRSVYRAVSMAGRKNVPVMRLGVYPAGGNMADYVINDRFGKPRNILFSAPWYQFDPGEVALGDKKFDQYGNDNIRKRVASIGGSSLCFPVFGPGEMAKTGGLHGEANIVVWDILDDKETEFSITATLPITGWRLRRTFRFLPGESAVNVVTDYKNLGNETKNVTWAEHMNFGEFAAQSRLYLPWRTRVFNNPAKFHPEHSLYSEGGRSVWPIAEGRGGSKFDMTTFSVPGYENMPQSDYTAQVIDPSFASGWFILHNAQLGIAMTVLWPRHEAPFLARWIENRARTFSPWNGRTQVMGLELARSPFANGVESAVEMRHLEGESTYLSVPAQISFSTQFWMKAVAADEIGDPVEFLKKHHMPV